MDAYSGHVTVQVFSTDQLFAPCKACVRIMRKLCQPCISTMHKLNASSIFLAHAPGLSEFAISMRPVNSRYWMHGERKWYISTFFESFSRPFYKTDDAQLISWISGIGCTRLTLETV